MKFFKSANTFSVYWWSLDHYIYFRTSLASMNCWCYLEKQNVFNSSIYTKHKIGVPSFSVKKRFLLSHWLVISYRTTFPYTSKQKHLCHNHRHDLWKYVIRCVKLLKMMIKNCLLEATCACVHQSKRTKFFRDNIREIWHAYFIGWFIDSAKNVPFPQGHFFL